MSIRIRTVDGVTVAICAARSVEKPGDIYLDDAAHHALADKFSEDFGSEGFNTRSLYPEQARVRAQEESNNPNREWWDRTYGEEATVTGEYHAKDGWFFHRDATGGVVIVKRVSDDPTGLAEKQISLPADAWASVVASVSRDGETADTWQRALKFHDHGTHTLQEAPSGEARSSVSEPPPNVGMWERECRDCGRCNPDTAASCLYCWQSRSPRCLPRDKK